MAPPADTHWITLQGFGSLRFRGLVVFLVVVTVYGSRVWEFSHLHDFLEGEGRPKLGV